MAVMELCEPVSRLAAGAEALALTTPRLLLRAPREADLDSLARLHADPAVNRFCAGAAPQGRAAVAEQLQGWVSHWRQHGFGHWVIAQRNAPDALVGVGGLMRRSVAGHTGLYLYYRMLPQVWGQGLAAEMAQRALALAFGPLGEPAVLAAVPPANMPTRQTLERLGLRLKGAVAEVPGRAHSLLYELTRTGWAQLPPGQPEAVAFAA